MATTRTPGAWFRIAFAMFAVGWGANQFSPMLIVYRHELRLTEGEVAGLFLVYALTLIPGLLIGGPASDRFGRRPVVWPFVALSPLATLLLVLGPRSLAVIAAGRTLAGLCSGVVFGSATAWVQEVSPDDGLSARRSALALTAGFGLGPVVAAMLAQWARDPLVVPYLPHLLMGGAAAVMLARTPEGAPAPRAGGPPPRSGAPRAAGRHWPPAAVRTRSFWLGVARASPMVFGSVSLAIVVLPEDVTSARSLSAGFAGLMTALSFAASLNHPNVIPIYDMGSQDDLLYIAMRYVSGTDLRQMIKKRGRILPATALFLLGQAARALDAAHRKGLVHRDVKPGNLLIERGSDDADPDHVYLADFGITKHAMSRSGLTSTPATQASG